MMFRSPRKKPKAKRSDTPEAKVDRFLKRVREEEENLRRKEDLLRSGKSFESSDEPMVDGIRPSGDPDFVIMYDEGGEGQSRKSIMRSSLPGTPSNNLSRAASRKSRFSTSALDGATPDNTADKGRWATSRGSAEEVTPQQTRTFRRTGSVASRGGGGEPASAGSGRAQSGAKRPQTVPAGAVGAPGGALTVDLPRPRSVGNVILPTRRLTILPELNLPANMYPPAPRPQPARPATAGAEQPQLTMRVSMHRFVRGTQSQGGVLEARKARTARSPSRMRSPSRSPSRGPGSPSPKSRRRRGPPEPERRMGTREKIQMLDAEHLLDNDFWLGGTPYGRASTPTGAPVMWDDDMDSPTSSMANSPRSSEGPRTPGVHSVSSSVGEAMLAELWRVDHIDDAPVNPLRTYTDRDLQLSLRMESPKGEEEVEKLRQELKSRLLERESAKAQALIDAAVDVDPAKHHRRRSNAAGSNVGINRSGSTRGRASRDSYVEMSFRGDVDGEGSDGDGEGSEILFSPAPGLTGTPGTTPGAAATPGGLGTIASSRASSSSGSETSSYKDSSEEEEEGDDHEKQKNEALQDILGDSLGVDIPPGPREPGEAGSPSKVKSPAQTMLARSSTRVLAMARLEKPKHPHISAARIDHTPILDSARADVLTLHDRAAVSKAEVQIQHRMDTARFGQMSSVSEWHTSWKDLLLRGHMVDLSYSKMGSPQLIALSRCLYLPRNIHIRIVNVMDNSLSDEGIAPLMDAVRDVRSITALDLSRNKLTYETAERLAAVTGADSPMNIRELVMGHNPLGDRGVKVLCRSVQTDEAIWRLSLQNVGAGDASSSELGEMLANNDTLKVLDFSRNSIREKGAADLAEGMCSNQCLQEVDLSHNGLGDKGGSHIANYLDISSLQCLNLSNNNLSAGCCMVLANRLLDNKTMDTLVLNENPLTLVGASKLLSALMNTSCGLRTINMVNCSFVQLEGQTENIIGFDEANPNKRYRLDLAQPIKREVAIELVQRWLKEEGLWKNEHYDGKPFTLTKAMDWPARLPVRGVLEVDYVSVGRLPESASPLADEQFYPLWTHEVTLQSDHWKLSYVKMLASQVYFTARQAKLVVSSFLWPDVRGAAFMEIFGRLVDPQNIDVIMANMGAREKMELLERLGMLQVFNPANLTGHYVLNLSRQLDYTIACRLLAEYSTEIGLSFCTPNQLQFCWRNVMVGNTAVMPWDVDPKRFQMPRAGILVLDYTSYRFPSTGHRYEKMSTIQSRFVIETITGGRVTRNPLIAMRDFHDRNKLMIASSAYQAKRSADIGKMNAATAAAAGGTTGAGAHRSSSQPDLGLVGGGEGAAQASASLLGESEGGGFDGDRPPSAEKEGSARKGSGKSRRASAKGRKGKGAPRRASVGAAPEVLPGRAEVEALLSTELDQADVEGDAIRARGGAAAALMGLRRYMVKEHEEDFAIRFLRQVAAEVYVTCEQVQRIVDCFEDDPPPPAAPPPPPRTRKGKAPEAAAAVAPKHKPRHRKVEVLLAFFARMIDREKITDLLRRLPTPDQVAACHRLGWLTVFDAYKPDMHYKLRLNRRDEEEVARRLVKLARRIPKFSNFRNLRINDVGNRQFKEDGALWNILTGGVRDGEVSQNVIEFDFVSSTKQRELAAVVLVQTTWRRHQARRVYLNNLKKIIKIQLHWFGYQANRLKEIGTEAEGKQSQGATVKVVAGGGRLKNKVRARRYEYLQKQMAELDSTLQRGDRFKEGNSLVHRLTRGLN